MSKPLVPKAGHPTEDEMYMIRECILLPAIMTMLDNEHQKQEWSSNTFKTLYLGALDIVIDKVHKEFAFVRRELASRKIKTWNGDSTDFAIYINYNCRGYDGNFFVTRDVAKSEIRLRFGRYIHDTLAMLKG